MNLLDAGEKPEKNRVAVIVERPDPDGRRWQAVLDLLLAAGRDATEPTPTR